MLSNFWKRKARGFVSIFVTRRRRRDQVEVILVRGETGQIAPATRAILDP